MSKITPVIQSEASECGLACLAMVLEAHGSKASLASLRHQFKVSLKGVKLSHLIEMCQRSGLETRALRLELGDLKNLQCPCILHWDFNHFVVLTDVNADRITILDPAAGKQKLPLEEVSKHFTGVALELKPGAQFKPALKAPAVSLRDITGHIRGLWSAIAQILALSVALQVFVILAPFYMQWVVDQALVSADRSLLTVLGIGFGLVLILQVAISVLRGWAVITLSSRLGLQWMGSVFAHALRLPLDYFEKRHLGDITSRMSSVQSIQRTLTTSFVEALIDGLMAIVTFGLMVFYSWKLALVTLVAVAIYFAIRYFSYRPFHDGIERQLINSAKQQTHLLESLRGMQSIKVAGAEGLRRSVYENLMTDTVNQDIRVARMGLAFTNISQFLFGVERIAVIWIGAAFALSNAFSVGMLIAYLAYKDQFATRIASLIDKYMDFRMLRLHGERLADIVLTEPEDEGFGDAADTPADTRILVENLSYRYADSEPWIIKDCNFTVEPGESVALVGASGCGKTTLVKLMLGLLQPSSGRILIGGQNIVKVGPRAARRIIGAVMQDDQLFGGSIADNISFFDNDAEPAKVERAAKLAAIHDEIASMPMNYHSLIGDMGNSLSGGQKQRVILARALYREPKILFLDEATSHLDIHREQLVSAAVKELAVTKVMVAHRPETIASADRILVICGGKVTQEVTPPPRTSQIRAT